jgi:hypothetical protein
MHPSSFDIIKHLVDLYQGEQQRLTYELSRLIDYKVDSLSMKINELRSEVKKVNIPQKKPLT